MDNMSIRWNQSETDLRVRRLKMDEVFRFCLFSRCIRVSQVAANHWELLFCGEGKVNVTLPIDLITLLCSTAPQFKSKPAQFSSFRCRPNVCAITHTNATALRDNSPLNYIFSCTLLSIRLLSVCRSFIHSLFAYTCERIETHNDESRRIRWGEVRWKE